MIAAVALTVGLHPEIVPSSVQKINDAFFVLPPDVTLKAVVALEITPVTSPPSGVVGVGIVTIRVEGVPFVA